MSDNIPEPDVSVADVGQELAQATLVPVVILQQLSYHGRLC
mgnify:CR=1 FL=1